MSALIKICGLFRIEDVKAANAAGPDFVGFVFAKSRRQVTPALAQELRGALAPEIAAVGVFVNAPAAQLAQIAHDCRLSAVQLHGDEDAAYVRALRGLLPRGCEIFKAARVKDGTEIEQATRTGADRLLLDAFSAAAHGGTGKVFDWSLLASPAIDRPFFVAGGIGTVNAGEALRAACSAAARTGVPFGLDVSGGAETNGVKDPEKMAALVRIVRQGG